MQQQALAAPQPFKTTPPMSTSTSFLSNPSPSPRSPFSTSPPSRTGFSPTTTAFLTQFQVQNNPKSITPSSFNKLSLNTSSHDSTPFSSFNPYFISPSNRCKSPSLTINPAFTFASAAAAYCPSPSMSNHSPRMGVKEANETWEAQWSPFGRGKAPVSSPTNGTASTGKFRWSYEEGGHERDKGEDDSTSEEEGEEERKEMDNPPPPQLNTDPTTFGFDVDPFPSSAAPAASARPSTSSSSASSSTSSSAGKYSAPSVSPRGLLSTLTPKTRKASFTAPITIFPVPSSSFSIFPVPTVTSPPPPPNSPPRISAANRPDNLAATHAPPKMATAAVNAVATAGASPAVLAAAALLKRNTNHNKTIAATAEELFKDLETPREPRPRAAGEKTVGFADEKGLGLAEVHVVPDDFTQYPIPDKKKVGKGKPKGKEKCRVM